MYQRLSFEISLWNKLIYNSKVNLNYQSMYVLYHHQFFAVIEFFRLIQFHFDISLAVIGQNF